jgi:hypothetical protein
LWFYHRSFFGTNPEAKHFPGICLIPIAVIVIPIAESCSWNVSGEDLGALPERCARRLCGTAVGAAKSLKACKQNLYLEWLIGDERFF